MAIPLVPPRSIPLLAAGWIKPIRIPEVLRWPPAAPDPFRTCRFSLRVNSCCCKRDWYPYSVIPSLRNRTQAWCRTRVSVGRLALCAALLTLAPAACHKEEQAVANVAQHAAQQAAQAQQHVQAVATERDAQRSAMAKIPLPTKSLYLAVHDPSEWKNPFISVDAESFDLHVIMADANPSPIGEGSMLRPEAARRQELQIRPADLTKALLALPDRAWPYGRVVAIAESPEADRKRRPLARRNVEAAIQRLNDLGIVVEEWPTR